MDAGDEAGSVFVSLYLHPDKVTRIKLEVVREMRSNSLKGSASRRFPVKSLSDGVGAVRTGIQYIKRP